MTHYNRILRVTLN